MKFKYFDIAEEFFKLRKRNKDYDTQMRTAYDNGMIDVLDAISDAHPELLNKMYTIRQTIEDLIEIKETPKNG